MEKITFENATLVNEAKVTIDGVDHLVTEAEYSGGTDLNAETFNQLQDNVEEAITEAETSAKEYTDGFQTYSTEEKVVGTFEDGKPIYQKTVIGTYADGQEVISNVDSMVSVEGTASLGGIVRILPYFELYNNQVYLATMSKKNDNKIYANASYVGQSSEAAFKVTLKYTKTTD